MRMRLTFPAAFFVLLLTLAASCAGAQEELNGPTALIVSYRARPGLRAPFRNLMATEGVAQLERWRKNGVFASYRALFTSYADEAAPDMFLIVWFTHFTDLKRWQEIEKTKPGGLPKEAQAMASVESSATADILKEKVASAQNKDSQFLVLEYDVLTDMPRYASYVRGYAAPQFESWVASGALVSYACFVNQNPAGAAWSSFIVVEYRDMESLASREMIKSKARAELAATDPVWKKWSDDKSAIRKEKAAIPALSLQ